MRNLVVTREGAQYTDMTPKQIKAKEKVDAEVAKKLKLIEYKVKRAQEYPPIKEQLDTLWKHLADKVENGDTLDPDTDAMLKKILDVKKKYPKPSD